MANLTPALDNGIQNLKVVLGVVDGFSKTPTILSGFAPGQIIELDPITNTNVRIGADGLMSVAMIPVLVTGRLYLQFESIGASVLRQLQQYQSRRGVARVGTLVISKVDILPFSITYNNFVITGAFDGVSTADGMMSDVQFNFTASLPDSNILNDLTNLAALGISILNGL